MNTPRSATAVATAAIVKRNMRSSFFERAKIIAKRYPARIDMYQREGVRFEQGNGSIALPFLAVRVFWLACDHLRELQPVLSA